MNAKFATILLSAAIASSPVLAQAPASNLEQISEPSV